MIRRVTRDDAAAICGIYNHYIEDTVISFEEEPLTPDAMAGRIGEITAKYPWFVREEGGVVAGYTYANKWKDRYAYRFAAEVSIYLQKGYEGRGFGSELLARLLEELRKTDLRAVVSGITIPNDRSIALHEKFGFKKIAQFNEIGYKLNRWLDVGYWELLL
ncbi:MAG: GNAT family N-acetyltransferase [Spirochaetaceae bacterium]|jgi:phosphinothricin acetyltransferase|nr:GNAT family N-acetyltransferase [Spirochaetaceae bacterium]